jgi:hypothetical protein
MEHGHHHQHHHGGHGGRRHGHSFRRGCGPTGEWRGFGHRRESREEWLASLEEYQKDLEQRVADVADLIRRLREEPAQPAETSTV